jgi:hypothetical protein
MSDITISVIQPPSTTINVGVDETLIIGAGISFPTHSVTHISGGSDEINHNLLGSLQGGSGNQYYHLNSGQYFNLVTGEIVRPGETGQFYPNSNPSGFITGVDLFDYATIDYTTGISGGLQNQINSLNNETGDYVLKTETGQFYSSSNLSGYTATGYVTGISGYLQNQISISQIDYIIDNYSALNLTAGRNVSHTVNSWLISNPGTKRINLPNSNYFLGDILYLNVTSPTNITTTIYRPDPGPGYVLAYTIPPNTNFVGSWRLSQFGPFLIWQELSSLYGFLSSFDAKNIYVNRTENQTITGVKNFVSRPTVNSTGVLLSGEATTQDYVTGISGGLQTQITTLNNQTGSYYPRTNPSGYITGVDLSFSGNYYTKTESESRYVNTTGTETILGDKTFHDKVYINNLYVTGLETIVNTTNTNVASNYIILNLTGGAVDGGVFFVTGSGLTGINDSGAIIGFDHSDKFKFGIATRASDLSTLDTIASYEEVTGISGGLQTQISTLNNATGNYALKIETGNFITNSQTGQFYANSNPSGFITGIDLSSYATQVYVTGISGDLQGQITDLNNATGDYILNSQTGQFYANSNPSGFITGVDLSSYATQTYVTGISGELQTQITNLNNATGFYVLNSQTGDFYANSNPSGFITGIENIVFTTGDQTISGIKTFSTGVNVTGDVNINGNLTISGQYNVYQQIENAKILAIAYAIAL